MKTNILGLDIGTNSIGWCLYQRGEDSHKLNASVRSIPMSKDVMGKFESGVTVSATAERTAKRAARRLYQRRALRRERLLRVLHLLGFLPAHFDASFGWEKSDHRTFAKPLDDKAEIKIAWRKDEAGKHRFVFRGAFEEMVRDFPEGASVPADWTLFYLRKKALTEAVSREELAWILLGFNQKRGYKPARGEEEETEEGVTKEYIEAEVLSVTADDPEKEGKQWYSVDLGEAGIYRRQSETPLDGWVGMKKEFIKTTKKQKDGGEKVSFTAPGENDWGLKMMRTEERIKASGLTVGAYIYSCLLTDPMVKIRGREVAHINRSFYREELQRILACQKQFIPELNDARLLQECLEELYPKNAAHRAHVGSFERLFIEDILFYQRPLKSQKHLIADCPYESRMYKKDGKVERKPLKCTPRSNPYFEEYRLWNFINSLRILTKDGTDAEGRFVRGTDVTSQFLGDGTAKYALFQSLSECAGIKQETVLKLLGLLPKRKKEECRYKWNYVEDREYPGMEIRAAFVKLFKKIGVDTEVLLRVGEKWAEPLHYRLWHLLYSVSDKEELVKGLRKYAEREIPGEKREAFVSAFEKIKPFKSEYASYSEKAIRRILPLIRQGEAWQYEAMDERVKERIQKLIDGEEDADITECAREKAKDLCKETDYAGLPEWLACYVAYGRHAEVGDVQNWASPAEMKQYILGFKHHSLRNPIVEQVVLETLRVVHDIWEAYGHIDEIHVEMARELKKTAKARAKITEKISANQTTNARIRLLLEDLADNTPDVRAYSPIHQEKMKLYEEGALASVEEVPKDIAQIRSKGKVSKSEITRYRLWLEQKYVSPYTGEPIPLSRLFTAEYEIEHIIPRSRYFDDSFNNKVICESEVNKKKDKMLAHEFIKNQQGKALDVGNGGKIPILSLEEYEACVSRMYKDNPAKLDKLMADEIPAEFTNRQAVDTGHIARKIMFLLSNIVRRSGETEARASRLVTCQGGVTARLRKDWGLEDVWNELVYPRFERMNRETKTSDYGYWDDKDGKRVFQTDVPEEYRSAFQKKRMDHRHHALDAITIACASQAMVQFLNNESANNSEQYEQDKKQFYRAKQLLEKPWETFTQDAKEVLKGIVISFKRNQRVLTKTTNRYEKLDENGRRVFVQQESEGLYAIRKSLHKDTVAGRVNLRSQKEVSLSKALECIDNWVEKKQKRTVKNLLHTYKGDLKAVRKYLKDRNNLIEGVDYSKIKVYVFSDDVQPQVASRTALNPDIAKKLDKITDTGIQKILRNYLFACGDDAEAAFSPEGIERLNKNIADYNNGRPHKPIYAVRVSEIQGEKFVVGERGNRSQKYVEAQKGTNLYCAFYQKPDGGRVYRSIPFSEVLACVRSGMPIAPEVDEAGNRLLFLLSPNDLVYLPKADEDVTTLRVEDLDLERVYKMVSVSGTDVFFLTHRVASPIADKKEFSPLNKMQRAITEEMIKASCLKLEVDRLGRITKIIGR